MSESQLMEQAQQLVSSKHFRNLSEALDHLIYNQVGGASKSLDSYHDIIAKLDNPQSRLSQVASAQATSTFIDLMKQTISQMDSLTQTTVSKAKELISLVKQAQQMHKELKKTYETLYVNNDTKDVNQLKQIIYQYADLRKQVQAYDNLEQKYNKLSDELKQLAIRFNQLKYLIEQLVADSNSPLRLMGQSNQSLIDTYNTLLKDLKNPQSLQKSIKSIEQLKAINGIEQSKVPYAKSILVQLLQTYQKDVHQVNDYLSKQRNHLMIYNAQMNSITRIIEPVYTTYSIPDIIVINCLEKKALTDLYSKITPYMVKLLTNMLITSETLNQPVKELIDSICNLLKFPRPAKKVTIETINDHINTAYNRLPENLQKTISSDIIHSTYKPFSAKYIFNIFGKG